MTCPDPYGVKVKVSRGDGRGAPRGDSNRILLPGCRVSPETAARLDQWQNDLAKIDPKMNQGRLLDWVVDLVAKRIDGAVLQAERKGALK